MSDTANTTKPELDGKPDTASAAKPELPAKPVPASAAKPEPASSVKLDLGGKSIELPVVVGTEDERGLDITKLYGTTGYITLDPSYGNTGSCKSAITYIDGDQGILRYRGYDIAELCEKSTFMEVSYLLIYGELPTPEQFSRFKDKVTLHSLIHEDMKSFFTSYPGHAHPMAILSAMV